MANTSPCNDCPPLTPEAFGEALSACAVDPGDTILVHSDLMAVWAKGFRPQDLIPFFLTNLLARLGPEGTLAVPAYFYEYARSGEPYDTRSSPVSKPLGVFARHVASLSQAERSLSPISAVAAVGAQADRICGGETAISYGIGCPWQMLLEADAKMVFVGAPLQSMTFVHYVEHQCGVPHLYSKVFETPISRDGRPVALPVVAQVRYLSFGIEYDLSRLETELRQTGLIKRARVGGGWIQVVRFRQVFDFLAAKLSRDLSYLLKAPPQFRPGEIPMDGPTGPARAARRKLDPGTRSQP